MDPQIDQLAMTRATHTAREILETGGGKATGAVIDAVRGTLDDNAVAERQRLAALLD